MIFKVLSNLGDSVKQTPLALLRREQLVCSCHYCLCIPSPADAGLRLSVLLSTCTAALCELIMLKNRNQTSEWLKTFSVRDLDRPNCPQNTKYLHCVNDIKIFHPRLWFGILCIAAVSPSINC